MIEAMIQGFGSIFEPRVFLFMMIGVVVAIIFGIIPGLGGMTYLALMIPLTYAMEPVQALAFLLAGHAVVHTSGGITSILINVPGTGQSAATLLDGFPMAQQGKAGRAVGNAVGSSAVGGVFGAIVLVLTLPVLRQVVLAFTSAELFLLCILGITFIAVLGTGAMIKGLISGAMGIVLSLVGSDMVTGTSRLAWGNPYLNDGLNIVPIVLGLFAVPEAFNLMATGKTIARPGSMATPGADLIEGVKDVFRHWSLVLRCSAIGTFIGALPGIGGEVAVWVCYGYAKQRSKHPEKFGHGSVEGVLAPEAADNSKEGGALIPTLGFGLPGSAGMAVMLGAFIIVGLVPGPAFLKEHLDIGFALVGVLVLSNLIAAIICLTMTKYLAKITIVPTRILAPIIMGVIVLGAFASDSEMADVLALLIFGAMGYAMVRFGFSRPALILGFILGHLAEIYLHQSLMTMGPFFFTRPLSLILVAIIIFALISEPVRSMRKKRKTS